MCHTLRVPTRRKRIKMSLIKVGIIVEFFLFVGVFLWVRKLTSNKGRQPSLSKKTIKNLKF